MKKHYALSFTFILICGLFWSCEKKGSPPTLPPAESMTIDFSNFVSNLKSAPVNGLLKSTLAVENTNWTVAATVAGWWNSILVINLAIPVAAFEIAANSSPTYLDNKTWQWKYSVPVLTATYTARLTGQVRSGDVKWEMYISKDGVGSFAEFLWYDGTTNSDGKKGTWTMKESQAEQVPMLQIDWFKSGTSIDSVKYTYVKSGVAFEGSYIKYGHSSNTLNAYYTVHYWEPIRSKMVDVNIEWSTALFNGRIKSVDYFQDTNWHCWDGNGNDIDCPTK